MKKNKNGIQLYKYLFACGYRLINNPPSFYVKQTHVNNVRKMTPLGTDTHHSHAEPYILRSTMSCGYLWWGLVDSRLYSNNKEHC